MSAVSYRKSDWNAEFMTVFAQRAAPPSCPGCNRTAFFGPRKAGDREYRLCKFCGFYQGVGADPHQCVATVHGCAGWPSIAGAPYIWWLQPDETEYQCRYCQTLVQVSATVVPRPVQDRAHPWWQVPQNMSFEQARAFWVQHEQPRVYL